MRLDKAIWEAMNESLSDSHYVDEAAEIATEAVKKWWAEQMPDEPLEKDSAALWLMEHCRAIHHNTAPIDNHKALWRWHEKDHRDGEYAHSPRTFFNGENPIWHKALFR